jgi:transposase
MEYYAGLDISLEATSICIVNESGLIVCERKAASDPDAIDQTLRETGGTFKRIGLEAGPLSQWLYDGLRAQGWPALCVDPRHMKASLSAMRNKTDKNDARGIAQMMRVGLYRVVHVKSRETHELRLLLTNRSVLRRKCLDIENEIRGSLKIFGLKIGRVTKYTFERRVRELIGDQPRLKTAVLPMLRARHVLFEEFNRLHRCVLKAVRDDGICRRFMTMPGVGPITALAFKTAVEVPERFANSKTVGAHFGLTPRKYASGQIDYQGHISKCGDALVRTSLYEAASVLLTRVRATSALKTWGRRIAKRAGAKRARVALARRMAVVLHRMWCDGTEFFAGAPAGLRGAPVQVSASACPAS